MSDTFWYKLVFKIRLYEADGMNFQNIVNSIFGETYEDFQKIAPWGSDGDGGNDGYIKSAGHYLQVYGPKARSAWKPADAARKAHEDFSKLFEKWQNIKKYSFVLNDRFQGIPTPVEQTLQNIQKKHNISCESVSCENLTKMLMKLGYDIVKEIIGYVPDKKPDFIDERAVGELIDHLANNITPISTERRGRAPDFNDKIKFNRLSDVIGARLQSNSYQTSRVIDFLTIGRPWTAQHIAQELDKLYRDSKKTIPDTEKDAADLRYVWMLDNIVPPDKKTHPHTWKAFQEAAEVILAHFFEACDVYDKPATSSSTP